VEQDGARDGGRHRCPAVRLAQPVKTHCQATYRKLGVVDRKAAVQAARDLRLL
jgi:hypothetical protein